MSRKHAELEREFIDELPIRTGRSLDDWMAAIKAAGLSEKNAIIDWLRPQGLTFAHASWLERIHNNGGRPIYLGGSPADAPRPPPAASTPVIAAPVAKVTPKPPAPGIATQTRAEPPSRPAASVQLPAATSSEIAELLQRAKGLRPLADMLLREIKAALPGSTAIAHGDLISLVHPREFAVLLPGPRELRLGLSLVDATSDLATSPARIPGTGAHITHMLSLNDARQVVPVLLELVRRADNHVNGG